MKIDGGCLCGHIAYEAEIYPEKVVICHCTDCQTNSGAAYGVVAGIVDGQFNLLSGTLKTFEKVADSGARRELAFCPECGTRIYAKPADKKSEFFGLRAGTITQRDRLKPKYQLWARSAQDWVMDLSAIPKFDKQWS